MLLIVGYLLGAGSDSGEGVHEESPQLIQMAPLELKVGGAGSRQHRLQAAISLLLHSLISTLKQTTTV